MDRSAESSGETAPARRKKRTIGYRQIASTLIEEIKAGAWRPDAPLPTEMELVQRFGVGRNTVREALRELETLGYILRRRGARSVLKTSDPDNAFINSVRSVEQLLEYAKSTLATLLVSETIRIDQKLADRLGQPANSEWVRLGILRSRDATEPPFCYSEIYLDPRYRDVIGEIGATTQVYPLIEKHHNVVLRRVVQDIEASAADANIASRLNVTVGSPILMVRTRFFSQDGRVVETGLAHFPSGRYRVRIALDRKSVDY